MKRAFAICLAVCTLGFAGFSQFSGSWATTITLTPAPAVSLSSTFTLNYVVAGWTLTSTSRITGAGFDRQLFSIRGAFGPFSMTGRMWFAPLVPEYMASDLVTSFDFGGVGIGLTVRHWDTDYNAAMFTTAAWPFGPWWPDTTPCPQTGVYGMMYILSTTVAPLTVKTTFVDCCDGIEFDSVLITLKGIGLCCGITYDAALSFTKAGFGYVEFTAKDLITLCCGISFDAAVKFTVDTKSVTLTPKWAGIVGCLTVYGDLQTYVTGEMGKVPDSPPGGTPGQQVVHGVGGIEIYGFRIRCTLADCNYLEVVHAWNVSKVEAVLGDIFSATYGEFEYYKLGFCGPGCCGGTWTVDATVYFGTAGKLFQITRFIASAKIPIMPALDITLGLTGGLANSASIGWTFRF